MTRREFLAAGLLAAPAAGVAAFQQRARPRDRGRAVRRDGSSPLPPNEWRDLGARLAAFPDLGRHFIFEYYPWYEREPWSHWDENLRVPPIDVAASSMPLLGPYDSRDVPVIEQHAQWIAEAGVGAINLSWWGRDTPIDQRVHLIMDVMRDHDIKVTFHLEPYSDDRPFRYRADVMYLLQEYGEKRGWDAMLLVDHADGSASPVFKSFATILPPTGTDCLGVTRPVSGYVPDNTWRQATDAVRTELRFDFDSVLLLCDTLDVSRVSAAGFDGLGLYDAFVVPSSWPTLARQFAEANLIVSFNMNVGFDKYPARGPQGPCFRPSRFEPPIGFIDWTSAESREVARLAGEKRLADSTRQALALQTDPAFANARRGVFLTYINSFNEWHEGSSFEPARDYDGLTPEEHMVGYHNPTNGRWRLDLLRTILTDVYAGAEAARVAPRRLAV